MVAGWTLKVLATALMDFPSRTSSLASSCWSGSIFFGLPKATPRAWAASRPSYVRLRMRVRSNSAMPAKTVMIIRPDGLVMSALGRRIHHGERSEIRVPLRQGQEEQLGALGLALNTVVHWNAIHMQEAIQQARADGTEAHNDDLAHLSPLIWRHLNFLGRHDFSLPDTARNGGLRPLRNPNSAWEF